MIPPLRTPRFIQNNEENPPHHKIQPFRFKCQYIKTLNKAIGTPISKSYVGTNIKKGVMLAIVSYEPRKAFLNSLLRTNVR